MSKVWNWVKDKLISRKFIVTVGAVVGAVAGTISWDEAVQITMVWLGAQGAVDVAKEMNK